MFCVNEHLYPPVVSTYRGQIEHLKLDFQRVMKQHVGARDQILVFGKAASTLKR